MNSTRLNSYLATTLILLMVSWTVSARPQENGITAIKTSNGFLLIWNQPNIHFTLAVKGKDVRPLNSTEHIFFNVDGVIFQIQSVAISEFLQDTQRQSLKEQAVLMAHRDWEAQFIEQSLLGKKLAVKTIPQKLKNGGEALLWKFEMPEMPKEMNSSAKEQIYLTVVRGDHIMLLNGAVEGVVAESAVEKFLLDTISTLKVSSSPINVPKLQEAIRKGNSR